MSSPKERSMSDPKQVQQNRFNDYIGENDGVTVFLSVFLETQPQTVYEEIRQGRVPDLPSFFGIPVNEPTHLKEGHKRLQHILRKLPLGVQLRVGNYFLKNPKYELVAYEIIDKIVQGELPMS